MRPSILGTWFGTGIGFSLSAFMLWHNLDDRARDTQAMLTSLAKEWQKDGHSDGASALSPPLVESHSNDKRAMSSAPFPL